MHDISELERSGLPGVYVATVEFIDAADTQSVALGLDTARVFTEHPIQDRTDDEMRVIADAVVDQLLQSITGPT